MKKFTRNEVTICQPEVYEKKLFHTGSFVFFSFIFSERITITSEEALKAYENNFFKEI